MRRTRLSLALPRWRTIPLTGCRTFATSHQYGTAFNQYFDLQFVYFQLFLAQNINWRALMERIGENLQVKEVAGVV